MRIPCLLKAQTQILRRSAQTRSIFTLQHAHRLRHASPDTTRTCLEHRDPRRGQVRHARRQATLKLEETVQGLVEPVQTNLALEDGEPGYPPLLQELRNNMLKFSHCVLLTRVGGFYELYFEHADEYAPLLNIKKTKKRPLKGSKRAAVSMAGFPAYQLDRYLKILVQDLNKHVAVSEEFINDAATKAKGDSAYSRRVTRIVTPGTLIDEHFMDPWQNNFLLSVHVDTGALSEDDAVKQSPGSASVTSLLSLPRTEVGLAWIDLSSGDFHTQTTDIASLPSAVARIKPREIVLDSIFAEAAHSRIVSILEQDGHIITFQESPGNSLTIQDWIPMLEDVINDIETLQFSPAEIAAGGALLHYVKSQLLGSTTRLQAPIRHQPEDHVIIDKNSLRALEIRATLRDGNYEGSLLHSLNRTVTKSGMRLLTQRLSAPSMSLPMINDRLDLVEEMVEHPQLREDVVNLLGQTFDSLRLVTKFTVGRGDADDLLELSRTIQTTSDIVNVLQVHLESQRATAEPQRRERISGLLKSFDLAEPLAMAKRIQNAIDEEGLSERHRVEDDEANVIADLAQSVLGREGGEDDMKAMPKRVLPKPHAITPSFRSATDGREDIWIMKRNASKALQKLHASLESMRQEKDKLEYELRDKLGADSLVLKWTPNLAHIAHVRGRDVARAAVEYPKSLSSSKSTRSFQIPEWTQLGGRMDETRFRMRTEEQRVLSKLREDVVRNLVKLRRNAAALDELDVACAFARLATEKGWIRPLLHAGTSFNVVGGRHPVVENGLIDQGRRFATNDCILGEEERIWLITGPNMAGKSTFLRQNAIISILAQTGSFVPADYAETGLVDKVFSRVGSADNLFNDQSTFMVEMLETAHILKEATPRSFVIMDEVGRGTTPEDGVAVGYACLHHLYNVNKSRVLFATHFHALADLTKDLPKLGCYCNDVAEEPDGTFSYVHRLRKGVNRQSHALKVATVAGLPEEAVAVAAQVLEKLRA